MPSPVPAGYTRGAIMFLGPMTTPASEDRLLQRFWNEAGAYGSRIAIVATGATGAAVAERYAGLFREWESDRVNVLQVDTRAHAQQSAFLEQLHQCTGMQIVAESALRLAGTLGGTPLAQTIRRMNAQSKIICAAGAGASILCQHMVVADARAESAGDAAGNAGGGPLPFVSRSLVQFAPGLGIVNRLVLDTPHDLQTSAHASLGRLLTAVAYNPFLIGVALEPDTGVALYANSTLEVFGENSALVVDGAQMKHNDLAEAPATRAFSMLGVQLHVLALGCTFNMDSHVAAAPAEGDLSLSSTVVKSAY